jgi:hypothetical protein
MKKATFLFFTLAAGSMYAQQEKSMSEIQAQMIYNFLKYIQWPNETEAGEFVVGVMGEDDVFNALKSYYDGKPRGAKKFVVKKLTAAEEAAACAVVYLGKSKNREFENIKNGIQGKSVLTITDSFNLGSKGSCINFRVIDGKLKFEMNQASLLAASLKVSNQLSSLAILI